MKKGILGLGIIICICIGLGITAFLLVPGTSQSAKPHLFVDALPDLPGTFIQGLDLSSLAALEASGVTFKNANGKPDDIFNILEDAEYNMIRLRIWNNPYDEAGNGFGGGNSDLEKAVALGKRATAHNMKLLIDFHYSDFWADPAKQNAPRAWSSYTMDEKSDALYKYTYDSLATLLDEGVEIGIVQIGNETTTGLAGEINWKNIATLMRAGSEAVQKINADYKKEIQIAVHFTNPEKADNYKRYADILKNFDVEYDIFASSYYPYWHGSLDNLKAVLGEIITQYDKKVMIAETSYVHTFENGDAHPNSINADSPLEFGYPVSVQGQSSFLQDLTASVASLGDAALGIFYWEPAWIGLPQLTAEEQAAKWESTGSGWASSFAGVYDPKDAGLWFGGSSWDNQALFDFDGKPLDSLYTFKYMRSGLKTDRVIDAITPIDIKLRTGEELVLPETVVATFNDRTTEDYPVVWKTENIDTESLGETDIVGTVAGSTLTAVAHLQIVLPNFVENESFETGDNAPYRIENIDNRTTELGIVEKVSDSKSGTHAFHFYSTDQVDFKIEQTIENLKPGNYSFSLALQGGDANNAEMTLYAITGGKTVELATGVAGWNNWQTPAIDHIAVSDGSVIIGIRIRCDAKGWGTLDDFSLTKETDN